MKQGRQTKQKGGFAPSIMGGIANAAYLAPLGIKQMYKFYTRKQSRKSQRKQTRKSLRKSRKAKRRG